MRTLEDIRRELDRVQRDYDAKSSFVRMLEGNTPESALKTWRDELKPIKERLDQLRRELQEGV